MAEKRKIEAANTRITSAKVKKINANLELSKFAFLIYYKL